MSNKLADRTLDNLAREIYMAEKEIYQDKNVKLNQDKIDKIMSDIPFDKLVELAYKVEKYTQHDSELKGYQLP